MIPDTNVPGPGIFVGGTSRLYSRTFPIATYPKGKLTSRFKPSATSHNPSGQSLSCPVKSGKGIQSLPIIPSGKNQNTLYSRSDSILNGKTTDRG
jgi:hypothetical protein